MICITIAQESRRFALVDMRNAAPQCDLLEVRLDRFGKAPELGELLAAKPKPVILSCRRRQDGGEWDGTEDERLALLRQCIIARADHVEIELDVADQVRPFPGSKRVISYTNLSETPANIAEIYAQAQTKHPDVVKLTTLARTPEEAWPLVQILAKPALPTVVVGLGKPGVMLSVLGKKIGAPWTYAALEKGMEAYPGQPTVNDLKTVYHFDAIDRSTRFVGVTGFEEREYAHVALFNAALAHLGSPNRCLPLGVGNVRLFRKVLEAVKMQAVAVDEAHRASMTELATQLQGAAERLGAADLILPQSDGWHGLFVLDRAVASGLETIKPLRGRAVMLVGVNALAREVGRRLVKYGAMLVVASRDREAAQKLAHELQCRHVQFEAVYTTLHDVLVYCCEESAAGARAGGPLHAGYLKPGMAVADLTAGLKRTPLLREAAARGCSVLPPGRLLVEHVLHQVKYVTGQDVPRKPLLEALEAVFPDDE
jgi:3-dehydroquinate dehydratase / shikimate dehydrogenase